MFYIKIFLFAIISDHKKTNLKNTQITGLLFQEINKNKMNKKYNIIILFDSLFSTLIITGLYILLITTYVINTVFEYRITIT